MSRYVPVKLSTKNRNIDWINTIVQIHNLQCQCDGPLEHTVEEILTQEPDLKFNHPKKCHSTGEDPASTDDHFGEGDLAAIFAEDFGEPSDTAAATG